MKRLLILFLFLFSITTFAQTKNKFEFGKTEFLLNGKPFQIRGCELHPARIPVEYWKHRIQMSKALGCNTISVYIFWNYHENANGSFDFTTGNKNIGKFLQLVKDEGMWVLMRPGPYVCAEWDFGGFPARLLAIPDLKVRSMDLRYIAEVKKYMTAFAPIIKRNLVNNGGNILMTQIENEYGSYGNDKNYLEWLRKTWMQLGVTGPFYTADGATPYMLEAGNIDGAAIGLDSGSNEKDFAEATKRNPNVPAFSSETYPGWLTHWGEKWAQPDNKDLLKELDFLMSNHKSFGFYLSHGGTNFGFWAGANSNAATNYQPDVTSYDYDAPITEQGLPREKFYQIRELIQKYSNEPLAKIPDPVPAIEIPAIKLTKFLNLHDLQVAKKDLVQPKPMEALNQYTGFISYKTKLIGRKSGKLTIWEPHDYALVFLDGKFIKTIYRDGGNWTIDLPKSDNPMPELEILVEAMGRINFAQFMIDRKGITDRVTLSGMTLMNWEVKQYPMDEAFIAQQVKAAKPNTSAIETEANFFKGEFTLNDLGDTYFDLSRFKKGLVYVNGHNLGRFWEIGPQKRLFCPASWLKKGKNEIIIFDFHQKENTEVYGAKTLE